MLGVVVPVSAMLPVSTGTSTTGTKVTVLVPGVCPVPGPGVTAGGADSGGPTGVATVGIRPVVPGPGATGAGARSIDLITTVVVPMSTGVGPCVAILLSFSCYTDIYPDQGSNITAEKPLPGQYLATKYLKIPLRYCQIFNRKYLAL
jgi:hypothetical protein